MDRKKSRIRWNNSRGTVRDRAAPTAKYFLGHPSFASVLAVHQACRLKLEEVLTSRRPG